MKIVAISDTHNRHKQIKDFQDYDPTFDEAKEPLGGDIIIHAGDAGMARHPGTSKRELEDFIKWYGQLDFRYKIYTPGNHDFYFETSPTESRKLCENNGVILLKHNSIDIEGIKIFGSPWTPYFYNWAFNGARTSAEGYMYNKPLLKDLWKDIPKDTNILVTHGPPYEILDELTFVDGTPKGQFVGCVDLREKIEEIKPDIFICGHIHCSVGQKHINGVSYYNVCVCDETYYPSNPVTIIDYEKGK